MFELIAGIPADLVDASYTAILADARTTPTLSENGTYILSACRTPTGADDALPAPRLVQVARDLAPHSSIASICTFDLTPALDNIIDALGSSTAP